MLVQKQPFVSYTLDEEKKDPLDVGKVFTVRLNSEEYQKLQEAKKDLNLKNDSTTIKLLADIGTNVLHSTFGKQKLRWLFSPSRVKLDEE